MSIPTIFATLLVLAVASPSFARAQGLVDDLETRRVGYADLDLTTGPGVDRLYRRVNSAARSLCDTGGRLDLEGQRAKKRCLDQVRSDANGQIVLAVARATEEKAASFASGAR